MAKTIVIKALNGLRIPRPESSYRYVEGDEPVEVDVSTFDNLAYWTRRIEHGEAFELGAAEAKAHREKMTARRAEEEAAETKAREELAAKQAAPSPAPETPVVQTPATSPAPTAATTPAVTLETPVAAPELEQPAAGAEPPVTDTKAEEK